MGKINYRPGQAGENTAAAYLRRNGYAILERNYRSPWGEIDLIADYRGMVCFIEVKSREQSRFGYPLDAVDGKKQQKIIKAAKAYLAKKYFSREPVCRFDVISIDEKHQITLITDAFQI
jgi:putative endonuclease